MSYKLNLLQDKALATILLEDENHTLEIKRNIPLRLIASIMGQQLNTKVAKIIYNRFIELYDNQEPDCEQILNTPNETLRFIGLSNAKVQYVKNVAIFCKENNVNDTLLLALCNEDIIELLTQIKGVGKWTVEMLLMFSLGREDVFAVDDLGIQQAMQKLYNLDSSNKKHFKEQMLLLSNNWIPYRTYACLHLWSWKDAK
jgi:DNA-3-methyladenine glycosylase II